MLAILGSTALNYYKHVREPVDLDILGTYDEVTEFINKIKTSEGILAQYPIDSGKKIVVKTDKRIIEAEIAWEGSNSEELLRLISNNYIPLEGRKFYANGLHYDCGEVFLRPDIDIMYSLKMSHRFKKDSPHFKKTMDDIILLRSMGATIPVEYQGWYSRREKETYTNKLPSLKRSKADFFSGDGIVYEWDHDSIHEAVKHLDKPAYQYFSGGEVWSDMKVFETLPENIKLLAVLEESLTLAAERSQLAFPDKLISPYWSFEYALQKVCTSITSGKFRSYAWDNYHKVIEMYMEFGHDYMGRVKAGIASGVVKKL